MENNNMLDDVYDVFINAMYDGVSIEDEQESDGGVKVKPLSKQERKDVIRAIVEGLMSEVWKMHIYADKVVELCEKHECGLSDEAVGLTIKEMTTDYENHAFVSPNEVVCPACGNLVEIEPIDESMGVEANCDCGWHGDMTSKKPVEDMSEVIMLFKQTVAECVTDDDGILFHCDDNDEDDDED